MHHQRHGQHIHTSSIALDIVHDRIHVDHRHQVIDPADGGERLEQTIYRFDERRTPFAEVFVFGDFFQIHHDVAGDSPIICRSLQCSGRLAAVTTI